jgi:hypothetical protein
MGGSQGGIVGARIAYKQESGRGQAESETTSCQMCRQIRARSGGRHICLNDPIFVSVFESTLHDNFMHVFSRRRSRL